MSKKQSKEVAAVENRDLFLTEMPEELKGGPVLGYENATSADMAVPRIEIVQTGSPCRKKADPAYIEGAEEGMLFNTVTRKLYGHSVMVVPCHFVKEWLIWKDRKENNTGGFRGAYPTEEAAKDRVAELKAEGDHDLIIQDTHQHYCMVIDADGSTEYAVLSMSRTKKTPSSRWLSLIRTAGVSTFKRVYEVKTVFTKNAKGDYFNYMVPIFRGFPSMEQYKKAEALYKMATEGRVGVNQEGALDGENTEEAAGEY